ncbi:Terpene_synth domain-containing protein/Terpene_synth_C domain-containing protein [Cephalotus follicularis]|uniref:Terpene_synth domain-containing protein/Terpene_synth_C domain-containing protein n=1 Tax=Cephalotus follicularis TaxID=3775 RepID=A0A1Q3DBE2_CEPFO|nr:Terpene_synth domain-containing protein/Terpene_synth_C domain-containing protein [Cephalotus follicularis]
MNCKKEVQAQHQSLHFKMNSSEAFDMTPQRRSAHYKPNIWRYDFIESLTSKYDGEEYKRLAEQLKEKVKDMFVEAVDQLAKLNLVDRIAKLGLAYLFEKEIRDTLDTMASFEISNPNVEQNLYAIALYFRILRQHGYEVSQDVFSGFMDGKGKFVGSKCMDVKGLLELFEASHLALEGEIILDEAKAFSTGTLEGIIPNLGTNLAKQIIHALELSSHRRMQWLEVKWHINAYEEDKIKDTLLLKFAKLNFNIVQAKHQNDLRNVSRWWRNLGLIEKIEFSRDRLVESFMCVLGVVFEPQHGSFRKWLTKVIILIAIIDDVYDVYGSLEELQCFTNAVDRWDAMETQRLPECMKNCFDALYDTTMNTAHDIEKEMGWNGVLPYLKKVWADFCKSLLVEARWYNKGYIPSLDEYTSNAWISSSGTVILVHAFFALKTNEVTKDFPGFIEKNLASMYNSSLIIRLCNDLVTSVTEQERGDAPSSIICYMREVKVSEEIARKHIKGMINKGWKKLNGQSSTNSQSLPSFVDIARNAARMAHNLYQNGDGFGVQDREIKSQILSSIVEPFNSTEFTIL